MFNATYNVVHVMCHLYSVRSFFKWCFLTVFFFSHVFSSPPNNQFPSLVVFSDIFSVMIACFFFELELMALLHGCAIPWIF